MSWIFSHYKNIFFYFLNFTVENFSFYASFLPDLILWIWYFLKLYPIHSGRSHRRSSGDRSRFQGRPRFWASCQSWNGFSQHRPSAPLQAWNRSPGTRWIKSWALQRTLYPAQPSRLQFGIQMEWLSCFHQPFLESQTTLQVKGYRVPWKDRHRINQLAKELVIKFRWPPSRRIPAQQRSLLRWILMRATARKAVCILMRCAPLIRCALLRKRDTARYSPQEKKSKQGSSIIWACNNIGSVRLNSISLALFHVYTRAKVNPFSFAVVFTIETIRVQKAVDIFPQTAIYHKNRRLFQPLYKFSTIGTEKALCYKDFIYLSVCTRDSKTTVSTWLDTIGWMTWLFYRLWE